MWETFSNYPVLVRLGIGLVVFILVMAVTGLFKRGK